MSDNDFVVEGVETEDGSHTELFSASNSAECRDFMQRYTRRLDDDGKAGGWSLIECYDCRDPENAERLFVWERSEDAA